MIRLKPEKEILNKLRSVPDVVDILIKIDPKDRIMSFSAYLSDDTTIMAHSHNIVQGLNLLYDKIRFLKDGPEKF